MLQDENWKMRAGNVLVTNVLPVGVFGLLTGMLWVGNVGYYPKVFTWLVVLPTLVLVFLHSDSLRSVVRSPVVMVYLLFAGYVLVSLLWANPEDSIESLIRRPLMVLVLFVAINEIGLRHPDRLRLVVLLSAFGGVLAALYTLGRFVLEGMPGRLSGYGALYNPLLVSHVFGFFTALWVGRYFSEKRLFLPMSCLAIIVCGVLLLATGSRTPLVALAATVSWLTLISPNRKSFICLGGMLLLGLIVAAVWPEMLLQRGASYRPEIWSDALRQIVAHPWFGHGFNTPILIQLPDVKYPFHEPHNLTLAVFYALGAIGGSLWLLLYGVALVGAWRYRDAPDVVWFSAPVVYGLFAGMTEGGAFLSRPKEHWFLIWIPLALLAVVIARERRRCRDLE